MSDPPTQPTFLSRQPPPALRACIEFAWVARTGPPASVHWAAERLVPKGTAQLLINLHEDSMHWQESPNSPRKQESGFVLHGPSTGTLIVNPNEQQHMAGVVFRSWGLGALIHDRAQLVAQSYVSADSIWGSEATHVVDRIRNTDRPSHQLELLYDALLGWSRIASQPSNRMVASVRAIDAGHSVGGVASHSAMSPRRFRERFAEVVGLSPKQFSMVRRFQRALALTRSVETPDWSSIALHAGYFDQSHLVNAFQRYAQMSPARYALLRTKQQNHIPLGPST